MQRPLVPYEPNPVLGWLYHRFFEHIEVDETWARAVREAAARGTVVYVLRNLSFVDFFALDYLTKRYDLPQVRFANDLGLWVLEPMGRGWLNALRPRRADDDANDLQRVVSSGGSAALFLKRPAHLLERSTRGKSEGDAAIRALFDVQRKSERPVLLVPQVFLWSKRPDAKAQNVVDGLFGPREWPGQLRAVAQFLANYRHVTLRAGEPVDVKAFLAQEASLGNGGNAVTARDASDGRGASDNVLVRRITYVLLRRLERERRSVLGPAQKPADRLREEVVRSPKLQKVITDMAGEGKAERIVITSRALSMVREMEATLDMNLVPAMDKALSQVVSRMYQEVEVDERGIERLREASKDGSLILLPSHKSHVDYLVLSQIFYQHHMPMPLIAAGDNLSFFPLGPLFRRAGAFFIRRSFRNDRLYTAVVDAYVRRLIKDGFSLEFFLEGGRSRTGKLLPPKVGLLSMVVEAALGVTGRRVYFCPISIGYERFVEEKAFVHETSGGEKKKEDVKGLLSTANLMVGRYGRLNVQFGEPLTLESVLREFDPNAGRAELAKMTPARRRAVVTRLAYRVMNEINRVTAVTPGALVATALLTHDKRGLPHEDLVESCDRLARTLHKFGARFAPSLADPREPGRVRPHALAEAVELFVRAGHLEVHMPGAGVSAAAGSRARIIPSDDAIYVVPPEARMSLDLSKNLVVHFFVSRGIVATALLASQAPNDGASVALAALKERVQALSRLFKYEFQFRADAPFDQIFDEVISDMTKDGEIVRVGDTVVVAGEDARAQVELYASVMKNFVEGYRVAARGLAALVRGPLGMKDLTKRAITAGERMFLAGEIARREAVSRPLLENAYGAFVDQGYVGRREGKLVLAESWANADAVRTIEGRIAGFTRRE
jgi:glycerol-3-phosphate O-acyltransferase